ncbi:hypothetical protein BMS_0868 [Halobacteriovorax marinus SJ]|uniref:HNH nuclease domain-containing protein n=1 Tax=Halobacteriovorax marinus (strain ATCC BAA-682 / DSM 15412 / SJ) TaxID=862908 RepID=E1WX59_HALMS|nr:DUF968 domain-containing protein [Halobacteriovorax marinus]CBW25760.1 hypothetical protein BMS_0868 [Halobacteriovorax marinus SJ]
MEEALHLSKYTAHRNQKYLAWLREQSCVVSGKKAQCAHHIRLGTNGGTGLKPSDYFCIPLLNEYHTTGSSALHIIGEETFLAQFKIDSKKIFIYFLRKYLSENYDILYGINNKSDEEVLFDLITIIESKIDRPIKKVKRQKPKEKPATPKVSITESNYYQVAKKLKNERDKELRKKIKESSTTSSIKKQFKGNEFYEKAKEAKRLKDRELRKRNKELAAKIKKEEKLKRREEDLTPE